jgi:FkbM family methyltransferase
MAPNEAARRVAVRVLPRSLVGRARVFERLWADETELCLVRALLGTHGAFVDVGANDGPYSMLAAHFGRRVVAFEPNSAVAEGLRAALGRGVEVHAVALSDHAGSAVFFLPVQADTDITTRGSLEAGAHTDFQRREMTVDVATLDSFDLEDVALIKIDVEGHEWQVLRGALTTVRRDLPNLIVEIEEHRAPGNLTRFVGTLTGLGYEGFVVHDRQLMPVADFSVAVHQRPEHAPAWGTRSRSYVNNFIWVAPTRRSVIDTLRRRARLPRLLAVARA